MNITLYGAARDCIDAVYKEEVEELGHELGRRGHSMIFGGGATGLMGAAARGLLDEGGELIGVVPSFMTSVEPIFDKCTRLVETDTLSARKDTMEQLADAFVIVPGGVGTLDEFFQILTLRVLRRTDKPIVLFNIRSFWDNVLALIGTDICKGFISPRVAECFVVCDTPRSVVDALEAKVKN